MSDERLRRWRLLLGGGEADGTGLGLSAGDAARDRVLAELYDAERGLSAIPALAVDGPGARREIQL